MSSGLTEIESKFRKGKYKFLALDADNTLYRIKDIEQIYNRVTEEISLPQNINPAKLYEEIRQLMKRERIPYIYITKQLWFLLLNLISTLKMDEELDIGEIYRKASNQFENFKKLIAENIEKTTIGLNLEKLAKNHKIIVVSEEEKTFLTYKLKKTGLLEYIQDIISSSDVGYLKPHKDYFKILLSKTKAKKTEILYVDDDQKNVEFASKHGIDSVTNKEFETILKNAS